jgi:Flp pilus assembly protein TadG
VSRPRTTDDGGSAVIEFVMIAVLAVTLLLAVVQVGVYLYVRTVVGAAASSGARYAAAAGVGASQGGQQADQLSARSLPRALRVPCVGDAGTDRATGLRVVRVRCAGAIRPVLGMLGPVLRVDVRAEALQEVPP